MTALDRARGWFIAPPPGPPSTGWSAPPSDPAGPDALAPDPQPRPADRPRRRKRPPRPPAHAGWQPPVPDDLAGGGQENRPHGKQILATPSRQAPPGSSAATAAALPDGLVAPSDRIAASPADRPVAPSDRTAAFVPAPADRPVAPSDRAAAFAPAPADRPVAPSDRAAAFAPAPADRPVAPPDRAAAFAPAPADRPVAPSDRAAALAPAPADGPVAPPDRRVTASVAVAAPAALTSAAVLGRPGEVEPVAAALALALRLQTRAKAAAVAVVGAAPPPVEGASSAAAARRLAARLETHGHEPRVRGRLAWLELDPGDPQFASVARRVTLVAAPAVLAVTAARTVAVDEALNEQDLLILVTGDPEGALAQLAVAGLTDVPILTIRPLGRGPARALARAGVRPARAVRQLLTEVAR